MAEQAGVRAVWIVDGGYMIKAAPERLDYARLKAELEKQNGGPIEDAYYLDSVADPPSEHQTHFLHWLQQPPPEGPGMRVQTYPLKLMHVHCPHCDRQFERHVQKGVDIGIGTLMLTQAFRGLYDRLILSAGDGDFEDAVMYVKDVMEKEIWVAAFHGSVSADLQGHATRMLWLNECWEEIRRD